MLSIKPVGSSTGEVTYYSHELGHEDYYVRDGEPPGRWWGSGAHQLGLNGTVSRSDLRNLLLGMSADGEMRLVQNAKQPTRRAAFDLTFSVPKSVSALYSQCDEELRDRIEQAGQRAIHKTLRLFEEHCGRTRRGRLGTTTENAGLVGAICQHETARAVPGKLPDPNLHWHVLLCNVSVRKDGTTGALDARPIFERHAKMAFGALFRCELSKQLELLGLSSHRPERNDRPASWFELDGVPETLVTEFSSRRREIEKWLRQHQLTGAKASEAAAIATRQAKEEVVRADLYREWKRTGIQFGFDTGELRRLFRDGGLPCRNPAQEAVEAIERALKRITDDRAHFSELELLRFAAEEAQTRGIGITELRAEVARTLDSSKNIVRLEVDDRGAPRFTTTDMLEVETKLLSLVQASTLQDWHQVDSGIVAQVLQQYPTISPEQAEAVRHITRGESSIAVVNGFAGTGKTFMLSVANSIWKADGCEVVGTALAANAAKTVERESGIASTHIDRLLWELEHRKRTFTQNTIVVLDEAGMLGTRKTAALVTHIQKARAKLVMVGDYRQLAAIQAGNPFKKVIDVLGCAELHEIRRQRDRWARTAVVELAHGDAESALERFANRGLLTIAEDRDEACRKLVADWSTRSAAPIDTLILASTRAETATINRLCQDERLRKGEIAAESTTIGNFDFHVGDRIVFKRNNSALLVRNGSRGEVRGLVGEGTIRVRLDEGFEITVEGSHYDHIEPGYCVTTHKGQGQTVESNFVLTGGPMTDREMAYVQASRSRGTTRLYTDVLSGGEDVASLAKAMAKSRAKDMAHDYMQQELT